MSRKLNKTVSPWPSTRFQSSLPDFTVISSQQNLTAKTRITTTKNPLWLLCDTWTGLAFYIKIEFLSENKEQKIPNIIFNPEKTFRLGLAGCDYLSLFHLVYGISTEPCSVKGLLLRGFEGEPVRLPAGLNAPGWLAAGGGCCWKLLYHSAETNCSAVESVVSTLLFNWPGCFNQLSRTHWAAVSEPGHLIAVFSVSTFQLTAVLKHEL